MPDSDQFVKPVFRFEAEQELVREIGFLGEIRAIVRLCQKIGEAGELGGS